MMHEERQVIFSKGKVSTYNGMSDLYCDYVTITTGNSQQIYYLLSNKKLDNDLLVASPILKEAIDPDIQKTSLGLINKQGDVIIPFENRDIRVFDKCLLVIRSEAKSQSVLDAIHSRNDPTAAERMVDTNSNIKEKLNKEMNNQGKFLLNDIFSEGTLYSLDGRNILDNQYYSFIGMTDDSFYCSTNVSDSKVVEVPRNAPFSLKNSAPIVEPMPVEKPSLEISKNESSTSKLDISNVNVSKKDIDSILEPKEPKAIVSSSEEDTADNKPKAVNDTKIIIPTISSNSVFEEEKKEESTPTKSILDIPSVSLPEVKPEPIFSAEDKTVDVSKPKSDSKPSDLKVDTKDETFGDVVSAVTKLVQENNKLQQEVNKKDSTILSLQDKLRTMTNQQQKINDLEKENNQLHDVNGQLQRKVNQLEEGYRQVRDALNAPSSYGETLGYQKVA